MAGYRRERERARGGSSLGPWSTRRYERRWWSASNADGVRQPVGAISGRVQGRRQLRGRRTKASGRRGGRRWWGRERSTTDSGRRGRRPEQISPAAVRCRHGRRPARVSSVAARCPPGAFPVSSLHSAPSAPPFPSTLASIASRLHRVHHHTRRIVHLQIWMDSHSAELNTLHAICFLSIGISKASPVHIVSSPCGSTLTPA